MVRLTLALNISDRLRKKFLDNIRIYVRGGAGGQGIPRFGATGGRGGNVYVTTSDTASLKQLIQQNGSRRFIAGAGQNSRRFNLLGAPGDDIEIQVPPGISVTNDAGRSMGEVNKAGERLLIAKGADGGGPENNFLGQKAQAIHVRLDLKLIADIGLVGFPNAGKSTLLSALSRASPKIASYAFTTIQPQLGILEYEDSRQISMADLPGLIEGAHINVGMGHRFLKHVERTKMLLFVVDLHGFQLNPKYPFRSAVETILLLNKELELYKPELLNKPAVLALNKIDMEESTVNITEVIEQAANLERHEDTLEEGLRPERIITFDDIIPISAKNNQNTDTLKERLRQLLDLYADIEFAQTRGRKDNQVVAIPETYQSGPLLV